jgi:RsiW-degrading membrane proteinase PrsW (M82 family)
MSIDSQKASDNNFLEERRDPLDLERWKSEIGSVGWYGLIPFRNFFTDKPWTLLWVQFMAFAFGFPFLLIGYYREDSSSLAEAAWAFGIYFSIVWAVLVHRCIRPDAIGIGRILGTWFGTSVLGVIAVVIVSFIGHIVPGIREIFDASKSANIFGRLIGMTLAVGLVEETAKLLPVLWFARHFDARVRPTTIAYLGVISGLAFGATEAILYSISYASGHASSQIGYGDYLLVQLLRLVSLPFLHGIWTGIAAYFAGLSAINPTARRVVILAGLLGVAILHGAYNTFADGWMGFAIAMASFGMFIGYVRDEAATVEAVSFRLAEQSHTPTMTATTSSSRDTSLPAGPV